MKESSLHYMINTRQNHPSYAVHDERGGIPSTKDAIMENSFSFSSSSSFLLEVL